MKFGMLLSLSLVVAASALASEVPSQNVVGILRVDSSANRTVVAVPWVAAGIGDQDVKVTDIVKTSNLTPADGNGYAGDTLNYYNGNSFEVWHLVPGESGGAPVWKPVTVVDAQGIDEGTSADVAGLPRGGAIILIRRDASKPFYLLGQVGVNAPASLDLAVGTKASPAYSLIAPPMIKDLGVDINSDITWLGVGANDEISIDQVSGPIVTCKFKTDGEGNDAWKKGVWVNGELTWKDPPTIPAGTGFWFVSKSSKAVTVRWTK